VRADASQAASYQQYIYSEPTIHQPRPPERRATRHSSCAALFPSDSELSAIEFRPAGDKGKTVAMAGWGHLRLPFLCDREAEVRGGANQASHASSIGGERRPRSAGRPDDPKSRKGYTVTDKLSSIIIKDWLTVRTARKNQNLQP